MRLFVFLMEHGRSLAHEIDTVVESHPKLATNARLGWGTRVGR
jgi:hypothetical protein